MTTGAAEFRLCVQCCKWAFERGDDSPVLDLCADVDWDRLTRVVRFHRVQGLVWNCLWSVDAQIPPQAANVLSSDAQAIVAENLQIAVEASELRSAFDESGVGVLFVKGLTVAALAYPRPLLKMGWDIDILIDGSDLSRAAGLLRKRGYQQTIPCPAVDLWRWHRSRKESVWSRNGELHVELHTRLADNRQLIPGIGVHSPRREIEVALGLVLPTLEEDELFSYLCVHGASSNWFRVKWITDLAALLHRVPDKERLYARSQELGAHRAASQALLLADQLYGTLGQSSLRGRLKQDPANRWLVGAGFQQLAGSAEPREPASIPLGTWRIHLTQLLLKPGLGFKLNEFARQTAAAIT